MYILKDSTKTLHNFLHARQRPSNYVAMAVSRGFGNHGLLKIRFVGSDERKESMKVTFLLLCRVYLLADYLDIEELLESVMANVGQTLVPIKEERTSYRQDLISSSQSSK